MLPSIALGEKAAARRAIGVAKPGQRSTVDPATARWPRLNEGALRPIAFALTELTAAEEARSGALVKEAVS